MNNKAIATDINSALNKDEIVTFNGKGLQELESGFLIGFYESEEYSVGTLHSEDVKHYLEKENSVLKSFTNGYILAEKVGDKLRVTEVIHFTDASVPLNMVSNGKRAFSLRTNKWLD